MLRWGLARALIARRFHAADRVRAHGHSLCQDTKGAGPWRKWDVTVLVATTAVRIIGLDEGNHVCGVPAVHTGNSWWDESDEGNGEIVRMIQTCCIELRAYALVF